MKRKFFPNALLGMFLVVLLLMALGGCAAEEAPPEERPAEEPPEEAVVGESINLSFSTWHPPVSIEAQHVWTTMLEEFNEQSDGRITYTTYYGGALGEAPDHFDIVLDGMSDVGYFTATFTPGRFPLTDVLSLPAMVLGKDIACKIGNEMYERVLHQDFPDGVKVLSLNGCVSAFFWTMEPVRTLEDVRGLRIRTPGGLQTYMIEALGAEPVFMPLGDVYMSLETGVVDGIVTCPQLYRAFNFHELAKNAVVASFGCVSEGVVMNMNSWNAVPDDLKPLIEDIASNPFALSGRLTEEDIAQTIEALASEGVVFYELSEEEADRWYARFEEDVIKKWVQDMENQGLPGKETLLMYKAVIDKHGVELPPFPKEWEDEVDQYR